MEAEPIPHAAAKGAPARRGSGDDNEKSGADGAESDAGGHARRNEEEHSCRLPKGQSQQMPSLRTADHWRPATRDPSDRACKTVALSRHDRGRRHIIALSTTHSPGGPVPHWSIGGISSNNRPQWAQRLWDMKKHYHHTGPAGGGIGYGAPAGAGAAIANKKHGRITLTIQGDGDLMYSPGGCGLAPIAGCRCSASCTTTAPIITS
jgi:thiamine pyrophosphate-dependent enzyme